MLTNWINQEAIIIHVANRLAWSGGPINFAAAMEIGREILAREHDARGMTLQRIAAAAVQMATNGPPNWKP